MSRCTADDSASRPPDRKQEEVRLLLEGPHPPVPADLAARAVERGLRLVHRRRARHLVLLVLAAAALIAAVAAAVAAWPWSPSGPPATPPPIDW